MTLSFSALPAVFGFLHKRSAVCEDLTTGFTGVLTMANIRDIAQKCGVNIATVSRALNGKKGVSEKLRLKISSVANDLGYTRDPLAASLISKRSGIVGLVVPDISNPYYASVAQGVNAQLREQGYASFLCDSRRDRTLERQLFGMLCAYHVEGAVIISVSATDEDLKILNDRKIHVVCADNQISPRYTSVVNDNYQGACAMALHLINNCKVSKIAAVMGTSDASTTRERLRALSDTLSDLGKSDTLYKSFYITPDYDSALEHANEIVNCGADCLFCVNDNVALALMHYCQTHGISVPGQIKISGFDDIPEASMVGVPLTTVHQHKYVLGRKAAERLLFEMQNPDTTPMRISLIPTLVARRSCGESA